MSARDSIVLVESKQMDFQEDCIKVVVFCHVYDLCTSYDDAFCELTKILIII